MATILWMGPVSAANLKLLKLPVGFSVVTINKGMPQRAPTPGGAPPEIASDAFRALGESFGDDPLGGLLSQHGRAAEDFVLLASFSAGHGLLEYILNKHGAYDPRISGVLAADSYYVSQADANSLTPKPGFTAWGLRSIQTGAPLWLTSSATAGPNYPSCSESILGLSTVLQLTAREPPKEMPRPGGCKGRAGPEGDGGVYWLDYGAKYPHVKHATSLAPVALTAWLSDVGPIQGPGAPGPKAPGSPGPTTPGPGGSDDGLPLLALGYLAWRVFG